MNLKESTFQRSPHDRKNPYVMISREMAQDKSISPKAKGVLLYLLSLPSDWKIYHSQLQDGLGVGEDYINSALEELIISGYADRTRERVKGVFQPYNYTIREFKKSLPNGENRPGSASPENPALHKIDVEIKEKQQPPTPKGGAADFSQKDEKAKKEIDELLNLVDIPIKDKNEISNRYTYEKISHAIEWLNHPETKITKTLVAALKWACQTQPEIPKSKEDIEGVHKDFAKSYELDGLKNDFCVIEVLHRGVEFISRCGTKTLQSIQFNDKKFVQKIDEALKGYGFIV